MIYFDLRDVHGNKNLWLRGVSQSAVKNLTVDERKKLLTNNPTNAVLTPYTSGNNYVSVRVTNFFGSEPFLAYMKVKDYVKATTSEYWNEGKYSGMIQLIKNGQECFIAPYFED